jgi:uncharacterized membrane protein YfhO
MTFLKKTMVSAAIGVVSRKKTNTTILFEIVTASAMMMFNAIFKMLKNICVESVSTASTSRMIFDCSRPDCVSL